MIPRGGRRSLALLLAALVASSWVTAVAVAARCASPARSLSLSLSLSFSSVLLCVWAVRCLTFPCLGPFPRSPCHAPPTSLDTHTHAHSPPTELSNSFIITALEDLQPVSLRGARQTPCEYAVRRAKALGQKRFSVVVTAYWKGGDAGVSSFAFKSVRPDGVTFPAPTRQALGLWKYGLQRCLRAAVEAGFTGLQVLNHVDSDDGAAWRNFLDFDPLAKYSGWSYEDVVVRPAAEALRAVVRPATKVWFMVGGEMGRSLFRHPGAYERLVADYGRLLGAGKPPGSVRVGVALHWNKVCGDCFAMPRANSAALYNDTYHALFEQRRAQLEREFDFPAIRRAFAACTALGVSHYAPLPLRGVAAAMFAMPIDTAAFELRHWGVDLPALVANGAGRDLLFSEVGLGGGDSSNQRAAASLQEVAEQPLQGIWSVYSAARDPWRNAEYTAYRREWFR